MYSIRKWRPLDLMWLDQAIAHSAWESLSPYEQVGASPAVVATQSRERMRATLGAEWGTALVAELGGLPVGFALLAISPDSSTEEPNGQVLELWVAPSHRRQGLGRQLQGQVEGLFAQYGLRKVKLWTAVHNLAGVNLALKAGYQPVGLIGAKAL